MLDLFTINLEDYRAKSAKVFTGRDRGKFVRENSKIDEKIKTFKRIKVVIPNFVYAINPSFFEELFFNIITTIGKEAFEEKIEIENLSEFDINIPLNEAIDRILRNSSALG